MEMRESNTHRSLLRLEGFAPAIDSSSLGLEILVLDRVDVSLKLSKNPASQLRKAIHQTCHNPVCA